MGKRCMGMGCIGKGYIRGGVYGKWECICKKSRCSGAFRLLRRSRNAPEHLLFLQMNTCPVPEQCGTVWNGMEWVCLDNTCHPLSPPVNPRKGKILNWS